MPKVSREHMQARRDQIAHAAAKQFTLRGIHATSMADIVITSGLSTGAIYRHFRSRDDIVAYVAHTAMDIAISDIRALLRAEPLPRPRQAVTLIAESIDGSVAAPGFIVQLWGEAVINPAVRGAANQFHTNLLRVLCDYLITWLTSQGIKSRAAHERAAPQARLMTGLLYAHIVQDAVIEPRDRSALTTDLATSWLTMLSS